MTAEFAEKVKNETGEKSRKAESQQKSYSSSEDGHQICSAFSAGFSLRTLRLEAFFRGNNFVGAVAIVGRFAIVVDHAFNSVFELDDVEIDQEANLEIEQSQM